MADAVLDLPGEVLRLITGGRPLVAGSERGVDAGCGLFAHLRVSVECLSSVQCLDARGVAS
jgi:hypothetical protein